MDRSDLMYYLAYIFLFILLGVWLLLWTLGAIGGFGEMLLIWLLSIGILMLAFGSVRTRESPQGSTMLIAAGMLLSIFMLIMLAVVSDIIGGWVGASVGIILFGMVGLILLFRGLRLESR